MPEIIFIKFSVVFEINMIMNVWSLLENLNCSILWAAKFKGLGAVLISLIIVSIDAHGLKIQWEGP